MADSIYTFDPTASNNTSLDGIPYGPNQLYHNKIDDWFRAVGAKLAQFVDDLGGVNTVGGTANAITVTIASGITAYATGQLFWFKNTPGPNTTATTINVNSIGVKEIRLQGDSALSGGEMLDNGYYGLLYDAAYDGGDGGFILLNPAISSVGSASTSAAGIVELATTTEALTGTDTSRAVTPDALAALWEKGSDVASASTISLGEGGFFHITGTITITDIDFATPKDGRSATLIFDGALTLTHNATTLVLPGGANITTAAGDRCMVVQDSSDNIYVVNYQRASGAPIIPPSTSGNVLTSNGTTWVSSAPAAGGQPVPTSSTFAVGTLLYAVKSASGTLSAGATIAGSGLKVMLAASNGVIQTSGTTQTGTWLNITGDQVLQNQGAYFVRTA